MDISCTKSNDTAELTLRHPGTGEETDIKIMLHGPDSRVHAQFQEDLTNQAINSNRKTLTAIQLKRRVMRRLVRCTASWANMEKGGVELECNEENVKEIYTEFPWIKEQVADFLEERSNFLEVA